MLQTIVLVLTRPHRTHSGQRNRFFFFFLKSVCVDQVRLRHRVLIRDGVSYVSHTERTHSVTEAGIPWRLASIAVNALMIDDHSQYIQKANSTVDLSDKTIPVFVPTKSRPPRSLFTGAPRFVSTQSPSQSIRQLPCLDK